MKKYIVIAVLFISTVMGCSGSKIPEAKVISSIEHALKASYGKHDTVIKVDTIQYTKSDVSNYAGSAEVTMRNNDTIEMYRLAIIFNMTYDGEKLSLQLEQIKNL